MAVITVDRKDFCNLVGKEFAMEEIEQTIPMMGVGWEGLNGDSFDIEVFPNRPDMLSVEGLARAYSSYMGIRTGLKKYKLEASEEMVIVEEKVMKTRPYFVSCIIKNVRFTNDFIRSIMQLQEKLHLTHCRKRKKVAIGLHDYDKIIFPVIYTAKPKSFSFIPLECSQEMSLQEILEKLPKGSDYSWILEGMEEYPILHDSRGRVLSMPPIINSEQTKLEESTKNVFVDITATDQKAADEVLNIIATTFADRGASIHKIKIKSSTSVFYKPDLSPKLMGLSSSYVNKLLGLQLKNNQIIDLLKRMGHDAEDIGKEKIQVFVPCYRTDIMHPIDLVEDVAIAYGYSNFDSEIPSISTIGEEDPKEIFCSKLRSLLVGYGFQEAVTFILSNKNNLFKKMNMDVKTVAETLNAKTSEYNVVRNWLLPSLMEVLSKNKHNEYPQNLFEVGDVVVLDDSLDIGNKTMKRLAIVSCHAKANFSEMKSLIESILANLGIKEYEIKKSDAPCYIKGRATKFIINDYVLARFGEINPIVLEKWGLEVPVAGGEVCVEMLYELAKGNYYEEPKVCETPVSESVEREQEENKFEKIETERLFYLDPYMKEADATVLSSTGKEIVLDKTIFFAFSGGQASDQGKINGINVVDVIEKDKKIVHVLGEEPSFKIGDKVKMEIDWERRYQIMRLHSAAHLVYFPLIEKLGKVKIIGSNVSPEKARIDFLYEKKMTDLLPIVEKEVNEIISNGLEIKVENDHKDPEKRWWKCGKWEMPCGGTHVRSTSEIGKVKLKRKNIGAGKERVEITLMD